MCACVCVCVWCVCVFVCVCVCVCLCISQEPLVDAADVNLKCHSILDQAMFRLYARLA